MTIGMEGDLYSLLGVQKFASEIEIRRAYRTLITKVHPDKGGKEDEFTAIQRAYHILSDSDKRKLYDETGKVQKSADEEFMDSFAGGTFREKNVASEESGTNVAEQITLHQSKDFQSHTAGFEAWMRARGEGGAEIYTADTIAEKFGVMKSSYESVALPRLSVYQVKCESPGLPLSQLSVSCSPLPKELEWGQVLVTMKYAPLNLADTYTARMGGVYGDNRIEPPFVCGHDGVGVVTKVGPGVKSLSENDWVLPNRTHMGTWATMAVWKEKDLISVPKEIMPLEYLAMLREMCLAYRLLEDNGNLKPGDCVILNGANSTVGQMVIQLSHLLRLRCIAVVRKRDQEKFQKLSTWLKSLGATEVIADDGPIRATLDNLKFFSKPKLALDAVGGQSAIRLADALAEGGELVIYGCMTGKSPAWAWQSWVFNGLKVTGFNLRKWASSNKSKMAKMLEQLAKLVKAGKLVASYTEYELASEFEEGLSHATADARDTKILFQMSNLGVKSEDWK